MEFKNKNIKSKKEILKLIKLLHQTFIKLDFIEYTERPLDKKVFFTDNKTKEKFKKIIFKYKNKVKIIHKLNELEYKYWRANFPMRT